MRSSKEESASCEEMALHNGLFWGYYLSSEFTPRDASAYLYLKKDAVDLTAGKLVLTFVRDEGNPVKVELPTK